MTTPIKDGVARIRAYATHKKWNKWRLAEEAGLHKNTLRDFDRENWRPRLDTLEKLENIVPADFDDGGCSETEPHSVQG